MSKILGKVSLRKSICTIIVLCCYGCFTYFSLDSFLEFEKGKTGINHITTPVTELELPTITVCPKESFRNVENHTVKYITYVQNQSCASFITITCHKV